MFVSVVSMSASLQRVRTTFCFGNGTSSVSQSTVVSTVGGSQSELAASVGVSDGVGVGVAEDGDGEGEGLVVSADGDSFAGAASLLSLLPLAHPVNSARRRLRARTARRWCTAAR